MGDSYQFRVGGDVDDLYVHIDVDIDILFFQYYWMEKILSTLT